MKDEFAREARSHSFRSHPSGRVKAWLAGGSIIIIALGVIAFLNQDKVIEFAQKFHTSPLEPSVVLSTQQTSTQQTPALSQPECPSGSVLRTEDDSSTQPQKVKRNLAVVPGTDNQCVCKNNYRWNEQEGTCQLDCSYMVRQLNDLRQSSSTQGSPEILQEIKGLEEQIFANRCLTEDISLQGKKCKEYQDNANQALLTKQYLAYFDYNKKYIDLNCSGNNTDTCLNLLAETKILKGLEAVVKESALLQTLQKEEQKLKDAYYSNPQCNKFEERCTVLEPKYGGSAFAPQNALAALSIPLNLEGLTPGKIFEDDKAYYDRYCTCYKVVSKYPTTDLIPESEKNNFSRCFELLYPNKVQTHEVSTQEEMFDL